MDKIYGIIDIGSNSVRLLLTKGDSCGDKTVITTRLAEDMKDGYLTETAITRTAKAVAFLYEKAIKEGAFSIYGFATAAVRNAINGKEFTDLVKEYCGLNIEVLSGNDEAEIGFLGAIGGNDGGLIDVGGASSEVIVSKNGKFVYKKSLNIGAVSVKDACGQEDREKAAEYIKEKIKEYGDIPKAAFTAIGGTATSIAAMTLELEEYDRNKVHGFIIDVGKLKKLVDKLYSMSALERKNIKGLQPERAEIIACGALILLSIAEKIGLSNFRVSENDNLEGYLKEKVLKVEKKN